MSKIVIHNLESTEELDERHLRTIHGGADDYYIFSDIMLHKLGKDQIVEDRWDREAGEAAKKGCGCDGIGGTPQ